MPMEKDRVLSRSAHAGVAQMVRALPCQGRGRGFKSRRRRAPGCGAVWLAHQSGGLGVARSNRVIPTLESGA